MNRPSVLVVDDREVDRETREFFERTGAPTVSKPFTQENIRQAVHQILRVPELAAA